MIAATTRPKPQLIKLAIEAVTIVSASACPWFLGLEESQSRKRATGGDWATTYPVRRMSAICSAKVRMLHRPRYQASISATGFGVTMMAARTKVIRVSTTANRKASGRYLSATPTKNLTTRFPPPEARGRLILSSILPPTDLRERAQNVSPCPREIARPSRPLGPTRPPNHAAPFPGLSPSGVSTPRLASDVPFVPVLRVRASLRAR